MREQVRQMEHLYAQVVKDQLECMELVGYSDDALPLSYPQLLAVRHALESEQQKLQRLLVERQLFERTVREVCAFHYADPRGLSRASLDVHRATRYVPIDAPRLFHFARSALETIKRFEISGSYLTSAGNRWEHTDLPTLTRKLFNLTSPRTLGRTQWSHHWCTFRSHCAWSIRLGWRRRTCIGATMRGVGG